MGSKVKHAPGTFCWTELTTSDSDGAKKFYGDLMGWKTHDEPIPDAGVYTMIRQSDGDVGALYQLNEEMKAHGVPPHWLNYVTVESAADTAARAKSLGGTVVKDAFDVMDVGAMAVIQDPTGATFAVWQPKAHTGFDFNDARPGTVCWNELMTPDADAAGNFYSQLFGWTREEKDMGPAGIYTIFKQGEIMTGGMMQMSGPEWTGIPPHWMVYFAVDDCDAQAGKVETLGGAVRVPPTDIPRGRFAVAQDPQGAVFSFIKLGHA